MSVADASLDDGVLLLHATSAQPSMVRLLPQHSVYDRPGVRRDVWSASQCSATTPPICVRGFGITYLVSLIAEHQRAAACAGGGRARRLGLFRDRALRRHDRRHQRRGAPHHDAEEEEDVDPRIMLGFTIVNLFVDIFARAVGRVPEAARAPLSRSRRWCSRRSSRDGHVGAERVAGREPRGRRAAGRQRSPRDEPAAATTAALIPTRGAQPLPAFAHVLPTRRARSRLTMPPGKVAASSEMADAVARSSYRASSSSLRCLAYETIVQLVASGRRPPAPLTHRDS